MKKCPISFFERKHLSFKDYLETEYSKKHSKEGMFVGENYQRLMFSLPKDIAKKIKQEQFATIWDVYGLPFKAYAAAIRNDTSCCINGYLIANGFVARLLLNQYMSDSNWDDEQHGPISVHGGWTMGSREFRDWGNFIGIGAHIPAAKIQTVAGFDTAHCNDVMPMTYFLDTITGRARIPHIREYETYRDLRYVREELADAAIELHKRCTFRNITRLALINLMDNIKYRLKKAKLKKAK